MLFPILHFVPSPCLSVSMAAFSSLFPLSPLIPTKLFCSLPHFSPIPSTIHLRSPPSPSLLHLYASRRISNYIQEGGLVTGSRQWGRSSAFEDDDVDEDTDEEGEDDRSLDLLVRFVQNIFRKISRRARKAVRSVLPISFSARLLAIEINGDADSRASSSLSRRKKKILAGFFVAG